MNLDFLSAFANNPITLAILVIGGAVFAFIWKGQPFIKDLFGDLHMKIDQIMQNDKMQSKAIGEMRMSIRYNSLDILRITIYNEKVDIEDRLVAAKRYFVQGGNGKVLEYVIPLTKDNPVIWKTILAMLKPDEQAAMPKELL
jgi:hypothetical protein